jgi:hypothetical protein
MPFDCRLTDRRLTESSFFSENGHLTEFTFVKKCCLTEKNCAQDRLTENFFWIWRFLFIKQRMTVLDHFTEKSFHQKNLIERPFDRNTIWPNTVWPNAIWPKVHSTELPFNRTPFDQKFIYRKVMWPIFFRKWSFNRICFRQKMSFDRKKLRTRSFDRKFIWPKTFSKK